MVVYCRWDTLNCTSWQWHRGRLDRRLRSARQRLLLLEEVAVEVRTVSSIYLKRTRFCTWCWIDGLFWKLNEARQWGKWNEETREVGKMVRCVWVACCLVIYYCIQCSTYIYSSKFVKSGMINFFTEFNCLWRTKKSDCLNSVLLLFTYLVAAIYCGVNCNGKEKQGRSVRCFNKKKCWVLKNDFRSISDKNGWFSVGKKE